MDDQKTTADSILKLLRRPIFSAISLITLAAVLSGAFLKDLGRLDLKILLDAAAQIHSPNFVNSQTNGMLNTKPPFGTLLFLPLSYLPELWVFRIWDLLNLALPFLIFRSYLRLSHAKLGGRSLVFALLLISGPLQNELSYGQYNLLGLWFIMISGLITLPLLALSLATMAIMLKPSNLCLLPFVYYVRELRHNHSYAKSLRIQIFALVIFAGIYTAFLGFPRLWADHLNYLRASKTLYSSYVDTDTNFSVLRYLRAFAVFQNQIYSSLFVGISLISSLVISALRPKAEATLAILCLITLLFSPLTWSHNFVLLLPSIFFLQSTLREASTSTRLQSFAALVIISLLMLLMNPSVLGREFFDQLRSFPVYPLVFAALVVFIGSQAKTNPILPKT